MIALPLLYLCVCAAAAHTPHDVAKPGPPEKPEAPGKPEAPEPPSLPAPLTRTPSGSFRGSWMRSRRGRSFQAYRGIRYAQPPVGELRFQLDGDETENVTISFDSRENVAMSTVSCVYASLGVAPARLTNERCFSWRKPPVDIERYDEEVDASEEGPACPLPTQRARYLVHEDCLRLNVYTPDNNSSLALPVLLFIHPGGFYSMSGRSDRFGPHYLLDRDLVLVTINYRLASLGFLSTGDAVAPGNNGFKDQVSALRWVQRNAAAFGGDPGQVTIAGCSAGGKSVPLHMVSDMSKGLFHRGIEVSGAPVGKEPLPAHQLDLAKKQARILNCPTNSSRAIVDCLKTKTWQEMGNSLSGFWDKFSSDPVGFWSAVVEPDVGQPRFLAVQPDEAVRASRFQSVPLLISQTEGEFFWKAYTVTRNKTLRDRVNAEWETVAPLFFNLPARGAAAASRRLREAYLGGQPVADTEESARALGRLYGDSWVGFNTHRTANLLCRHSPQPVWYSVFSYIGNNSFYQDPRTGRPAGAAHHDDLIYLFSMSYLRTPIPAQSPPPPAPQDAQQVDRMTALWYNFVKYGDPTPRAGAPPALRGVAWPTMKPKDRKYLRVDKEFSVHEKLHESRMQVWDELYPMQY